MRQCGRISRFTADQIERIREIHERLDRARRDRMRVCAELGIDADLFSKYGRGARGKKPRAE